MVRVILLKNKLLISKVWRYRQYYFLLEVLNHIYDIVLRDKIEVKLIYDNTACRTEKGTLFAIKRLEKFLRHEYLKEHNNDIYFLKCDIQKYFPSIDHQILLDLLRKINFSEDEMWMIEKLVKE